jgi:hypothetical protein
MRSRWCVNIYNALYYILHVPGATCQWLLILWGLEDTRMHLRTLASTHISIVVLPPLFKYLQKSESEQTK